MTKYFTKSAFKMSLECPRKLYYAYDKGVYANQDLDDDFLKSLAEGGFQVGEFAKLYYGIGAENTINSLNTEDAVAQTKDLFRHENINIAEAAFLYDNMLVRVDVIEKKGNVINLIEVKAKSWNPDEDSFLSKKKNTNATNSKIRPYLYDVAFQKYVVVQALSKMFPKEHFTVHAFLMMADKTRTATVNGLNQLFKVKTTPEGRSYVETAPEAMEIVASIPLAERVVRPFDVDEICDNIIDGEYDEQRDPEFMVGGCFKEHVKRMANDYCNHKKSDCIIGSKCFSCQFHKKTTDSDKMLDGYCECWKEKADFDPSKAKRALIQDMNGQYIKKDAYIKGLKYFMDELTEDDLKKHSGNPHDGLDHYEKKWLQIGIATQNKEILSDFQSDMVGDVYLDIDGIKKEMQTWQFPLHFIDFETSAVALPFYDKMRPYEQVAFQFSHHRVDRNDDGTYTITHAGQFINTTPGHFPNFDFIRALKAELDKDQGTIFRYSHHENTILRDIHRQLDVHDAPDKRELQAFIDSITHYKVGSGKSEVTYAGVRDMVDLAAVVYKYYYHPLMNGGFSIKVVLPSVLNSSDFIKAKYSQPVYGTAEMPSCNLSSPKSWIEYGEDKVVKNPYKLLPTISSYLGIDVNLDDVEIEDGESVANGAAALMAYAKMQFSEGAMLKALEQSLLTYCELDTLAMVFIWEYFYKECNK
jgi:hypothetical protein